MGAQVRLSAGKLCPHPLLSGDSPRHNTVQVGAGTSLIKVAIRETSDHATYRGKRVYTGLVRHTNLAFLTGGSTVWGWGDHEIFLFFLFIVLYSFLQMIFRISRYANKQFQHNYSNQDSEIVGAQVTPSAGKLCPHPPIVR